MADIDKIVVITQRTMLDELVERFNTRDQARFYIEHMGESFDEYQAAHDTYQGSREQLGRSLPKGVRSHFIDRKYLPNFLFGERDLVVTLGRDGLVVNTAKYLSSQPLLAVNPDVRRIDGVLVPFSVGRAREALRATVDGDYSVSEVSMAKAELNDGQTLHAVNDLFIGQRTHASARYRLALGRQAENQSSSGIIVSTGAGSTGWLRSIMAGAAGVAGTVVGDDSVDVVRESYKFAWDADHLLYNVREPFVSNVSSAELVCGQIHAGQALEITSHMPQSGVIFSDGVEADYLEFNSGAVAKVGLAERKVRLVVPG